MNWEMISAIVEGIGAVAVIVSLIFLASEIRHNTKTLARTEARETQRDCTVAYYSVADNEQTAEIVLRGMENLDDLNDVERYRFDMTAAGWLIAVEQAFAARELNRYDESNLAPFKSQIKGIVSSPGGGKWWEESRIWFTSAFQKSVDEIRKDKTIQTRATIPGRNLRW